MSDAELRTLERAAASDPRDLAARDRLEAARLRHGLGWAGERLPENARGCLVAREDGERGVYRWAVLESDRSRAPTALVLELVRVPGGEVECSECDGGRREGYQPHRFAHGRQCVCEATGRRSIAPFYLGRFPVTNDEYLAFDTATSHHAQARWDASRGARTEGERLSVGGILVDQWSNSRAHLHSREPRLVHAPIAGITHGDALSFASWTGLRLPTPDEWRWAALGTPFPGGAPLCPRCGGDGRTPDRTELCPECCPHGGRHVRRYPWGNAPPSRERCVWICHPATYSTGETIPWLGAPAPVLACSACVKGECYGPREACADLNPGGTLTHPLGPARPDGASWCGAQDMAGNVWEMTTDPATACGGGFRSDEASIGSIFRNHAHGGRGITVGPRDDTGFRVALSAEVPE